MPVQLHEIRQRAGTRVGQLEMHGHRVAAEAEEDALTEGQHPAPAPGQADADGDDGQAEILREQVEPEVAQHDRRDGEEQHRRAAEAGGDAQPGAPPDPAPTRPDRRTRDEWGIRQRRHATPPPASVPDALLCFPIGHVSHGEAEQRAREAPTPPSATLSSPSACPPAPAGDALVAVQWVMPGSACAA